jgi:hypothetical protein
MRPAISGAQGITDTRLRVNAGVAYSPLKRVEVVARYRLTTHQDASVFLRSMVSLHASYRIMKNWEVGAEYRYNTAYKQDFHRYFFLTKLKYGIGDLDISYRLRYQQDQDRFDREYLREYPVERVLRNRLMLKYALDKKTSCYAYADHFAQLERGSFSPYRVRYGIGIGHMYKKRHDVALEFFVNDEFNVRRPEDIAAIDLTYVYHLKKKKQGKKNKHKTGE